MTSRTAAQHTVPHFYLKGFSEPYPGKASKNRKKGREIGTVRLETNSRKLLSTKDATVVRNFYTITGVDDPYEFEASLAKLEEITAPIFRKIINDEVWPLEAEDREILAIYMATQDVRTPRHRRFLDGLATSLARLQLVAMGREGVTRRIQEDEGIAPTDQEVDEIFELLSEDKEYAVRVSTNHHIEQIMNLVDKNLKYYIRRPWILFRFDKGSLITSDTPVSLVSRQPDRNPYMGIGLETADEIVFPLSRKAGIIMTHPRELFGVRGARDQVIAGKFDRLKPHSSVNVAKGFNSLTIHNSYEWLFHHPKDSHLVPQDLPPHLLPDEVEVTR